MDALGRDPGIDRILRRWFCAEDFFQPGRRVSRRAESRSFERKEARATPLDVVVPVFPGSRVLPFPSLDNPQTVVCRDATLAERADWRQVDVATTYLAAQGRDLHARDRLVLSCAPRSPRAARRSVECLRFRSAN